MTRISTDKPGPLGTSDESVHRFRAHQYALFRKAANGDESINMCIIYIDMTVEAGGGLVLLLDG